MKHFPKHQHKPKPVHVKELHKSVELLDMFKNIRYRIHLTSYDVIINGSYVLVYQINAYNYNIGPEPILVFERPEFGQDQITDYKIALELFEECIKNYSSLIKAETRDFQDIDVLKEYIDYSITTPECCATCQWSKTEKTPHDYVFNITGRLKCTNPENQPTVKSKVFPQRHYTGDKHHFGDNKMFLNPNVDIFGICPNYKLKEKEYKPIHGDSVCDIVDRRVVTAISDVMSNPPIIEGNDSL